MASETENEKPEEPGQLTLFEAPPDWEEHWQGMPEYSQEDLSPFKTLIVHFASQEDMAAFAKLVGQRITFRTSFLWHPKAEVNKCVDKAYVDES